jgi:Protein of unknown function (DUF4232)
MRPVRIIAAVMFAAAVAVAGCARSSAEGPSAAPRPAESAPPLVTAPGTPPSTAAPPGGRPATGRCDAAALRGTVQGTEGAAGTVWTTIRLRNASGGTCTVRGIPEVRLLDGTGQPVTAPSRPDGPGGSLVRLRPGQAASFAYAAPNVCDRTAAGSRIRVMLPAGQGSLVVPLGAEARYGTCVSVRARALEPATTSQAAPALADRISDPQVAADRLVDAWIRGDRAAARRLAAEATVDRLFGESPPARAPAALPCRLADLAVFVCSYPLAERAELTVVVEGGASAGYGVSGIEVGD